VSLLQHIASAAHSGPGDAHASPPPDELLLELLELLELLLDPPPSVLVPRQGPSHDVQPSRHDSHVPEQLLMAEQFWMQDAHEEPRVIANETACADVHCDPPLDPEPLPLPLPELPPLPDPLDEDVLPPPSSPLWNPPPLLDEHATAAAAATQPNTVTTSRTFITASLEGAEYGRGDLVWQWQLAGEQVSAATFL
jgi:hypothetical protein